MDEFNAAWARMVEEGRAVPDSEEFPACPHCGERHAPPTAADRLMVINFTFTNDFTQDGLLDRITDTLKAMLLDTDFRKAMRWDGTATAPQQAQKPPVPQADDYAKPRYADYLGRPEAFDAAKKAWRARMHMLGFDPNAL